MLCRAGISRHAAHGRNGVHSRLFGAVRCHGGRLSGARHDPPPALARARLAAPASGGAGGERAGAGGGGAAPPEALADLALPAQQPHSVGHILREARWLFLGDGGGWGCNGGTSRRPGANRSAGYLPPTRSAAGPALQASFLPILFWLGLPELGHDLVLLVGGTTGEGLEGPCPVDCSGLVLWSALPMQAGQRAGGPHSCALRRPRAPPPTARAAIARPLATPAARPRRR